MLSNDEVKDGYSEREGHPVVKKSMPQWSMRITAYADRLLSGLDTIDWPKSIKEIQRNWIGKSPGVEIDFQIDNAEEKIRVFTTRIDTIYGVTFMVLAPESKLAALLTDTKQKEAVNGYMEKAKNRSERDRMSDAKNITGVFTGSYAIHPFSGKKIPVWIADYVLAGYGTGAVMAVPSGDQRDFDFAKHFDLPIVRINDAQKITETAADSTKEGRIINSDFLNGLTPKEAIKRGIEEVEKRGIGTRKVNYKLRDAIFGRQRYWGEPIPVYYEEEIPKLADNRELPLELPLIDKYLPTREGNPPLGRAVAWSHRGNPYELSTMPGWAGSSWYFFRYMDPSNEDEFCSKEALEYWQDVDLYIGGSEHAAGHLLYSRFWTKLLYDRGYLRVEEYARKLINQGMIKGPSNFVYRASFTVGFIDEEGDWYGEIKPLLLLSRNLIQEDESGNLMTKEDESSYYPAALTQFKKVIKASDTGEHQKFNQNAAKLEVKELNVIQKIHCPIHLTTNDELKIEEFRNWRKEHLSYDFILENGRYICGREVEKMSKSKFNVVSPDDLVEKYGADTLRMYEMFLGPIEQSKTWNTHGIEGVFKFLRKFWSLFHHENIFAVSAEHPTKEELKILHAAIRKVTEDMEKLSPNTSVSAFMITVNKLFLLKCNKRAILEPLTIILAPFAPHITEEVWSLLGNKSSIVNAAYPELKEEYLAEDAIEYPVSVNGKVRAKINFSIDADREEIDKGALANEIIQKW
ncbi:MAG: class I tRNA ligase family protein, partial [Ekhidna sp.]|nr:class I tRNA ligase family protein [Ekhidna sp.]